MAKVYLETSFVSYLAAWPSRDLIVAGHQQITHEWWRRRRASFELYISQRVIDEAGAGDEQAAQRRLALSAKGYSIPYICTPEELLGL